MLNKIKYVGVSLVVVSAFSACSGGGKVEIKEAALVQTPESITSSLREGRINREKANSLLRAELAKAPDLENDTFDPARPGSTTSVAAKTPDEQAFTRQSIAEAIAMQHIANQSSIAQESSDSALKQLALRLETESEIEDVAKILGLDAFAKQGSPERDVNFLFKILTERYVESEHEWDSFLIRYLLVRNLRAAEWMDKIPFNEIAINYFRKRIKYKLDVMLNDARGGQTVEAMLAEIDRFCADPNVIFADSLRIPGRYMDLEEASTDLIHEYGGIASLFPVDDIESIDRLLFDMFELPTRLASFRHRLVGYPSMNIAETYDTGNEFQYTKMPILGQRLYARVLAGWIRDRSYKSASRKGASKPTALSVCHLQNAIDHAQASIRRTANLSVESKDAENAYYLMLKTLDFASVMFDKDPSLYRGLTEKAWYELLDRRFYKVTKPFRELLLTISPNSALGESLAQKQFPTRHPYNSIYLNRALIELGWVGSMAEKRSITAEDQLAEYQNRLAAFETGITEFFGEPAPDQVQRTKRRTVRYPRLADEVVKTSAGELTENDAMRKYLWSFYRVELLRSLIEEDSARQRLHSTESFTQSSFDQKIDLYRGLRSAFDDKVDSDNKWPTKYRNFRSLLEELDFALELRFGGAPRSANIPSVRVDECGNEQYGSLRYVRVTDGANCALLNEDENRVQTFNESNRDLVFGPGIYEARYDTVIYAKSITFHPLAMLSGSGRSIKLQAKTFYDLWVDVSGVTAKDTDIPDPLARPKETLGRRAVTGVGKCWLYKHHENQRLYSLPGKYPFPTDDGIGIDCNMIFDAGQAPDAPRKASAGTRAGSIEYVVDQEQNRGFPLLVALGGDGRDGYTGADNLNCSDGVYTEFYTIDAERSMQAAGWKGECMHYGCGYLTPTKDIENDVWDTAKDDFRAIMSGNYNGRDLRVSNRARFQPGAGGDGGDAGAGGRIKIRLLGIKGQSSRELPAQQAAFFVGAGRSGLAGDMGCGGEFIGESRPVAGQPGANGAFDISVEE
jgi:hypothetical protein